MVTITNNDSDTIAEGEKLGRTLKPGAVVALHGELGAGKTTFTRGLAAGIGIQMSVTSPTFTIINEYPGTIPVFHFDMYRLLSDDELFDIGWNDYIERGGICVIEWSENVSGAIPHDAIVVLIENLGGNKRKISINEK